MSYINATRRQMREAAAALAAAMANPALASDQVAAMNGAQIAARAAAAERRWVILDTLGRHVTVGRHTDPSDAELDAAAVTLAGEGVGGWLAVLEGPTTAGDG